MDDFKSQVRASFSKCKDDISSLKHENELLKERLNFQNEKLKFLEEEIKSLKLTLSNFSKIIEMLQTSQAAHINNISTNASAVTSNDNTSIGMNSNSNVLNMSNKKNKSERTERSKDPYEELIKIKARVNKKDMLKQKILSLINEQISLSELKFLFVEHHKYCSKATFYNYLKELELENKIVIKRVNSRNIVTLKNQEEELISDVKRED